MGYDGYGVDGALEGHEDDLISAFEDGNPPRWLDVDDLSDDLEFATVRAEQNHEDWVERHDEEPDVERITSSLSYEVDLDRAPDDVRERLEEWLSERRDGIEYRRGADFVEFRYFAVGVYVTPDGEINRVSATAWFKNH